MFLGHCSFVVVVVVTYTVDSVEHILDNKLVDMKQALHHFSTAVVTPLPTYMYSSAFFGNPLKSLNNGHDSSRVLHWKMHT